jgi:hypothetical protein
MRAAAKNGGVAPPEARLIGCMWGAFAIPVGMFWFAWSSGPNVPWIVPVMAGAPFGFGFVLLFLGVVSYLIDAYVVGVSPPILVALELMWRRIDLRGFGPGC